VVLKTKTDGHARVLNESKVSVVGGKMKVKDLAQKRVLVKYGLADDPEKYSVDLLDRFKKEVYNGDYPFDETEIIFTPHLSPVPYSQTDRASMPLHYQCMGSLTTWFGNPQGGMSPFSFVDFWHTEAKHYHHNTWIYWRDFNGNPDSSKKLEGHSEINLTCDVQVSLWMGDKEVFKDVIPGKKQKESVGFKSSAYILKLDRF